MTLDLIRQQVRKFPGRPGVYLMKNARGKLLYAGKAASLQKRVSSYFQRSKRHAPSIDIMVKQVREVEYIETTSEAEALILEASLIKKYLPRYNVELKDDKSYPYLKLTRGEKFPRLLLTREVRDDGSQYFGPYTDVKLLRQALAFMRRTFPLRTCRTLPKSACLQYYIGQCVAPCIDKVTEQEYQRIAEEAVLLLEGEKDSLIREVSRKMREYSKRQEYESAAQARDQLRALTSAVRQSTPREVVNLFTEDAGQEKYHRVGIYRVDELLELKDLVKMTRIPRRIEAFDVSNTAGTEAVASMVSFLNGEPDKSQYKRFRIRFFQGEPDDYRMIREVVLRRYERLLKEGGGPPDLILVDGGKGQVSVAKEALEQAGLGRVSLMGLAKRLERVALPNVRDYLDLPEDSKARLLLQRIRDEAHRFAITYHRGLRGKRLSHSLLDDIPGIGPKRKKLLLTHFDSINALQTASIEELSKLPGFSEALAKKIKERL